MLELPRLIWYPLVVVLAYLLGESLLRALGRQQSCTVVITGESVKIIGCEFTESFIEYAKQLKPARHW